VIDTLTSRASREPSEASGRAPSTRIAPSPTGYLHLGHARTFWIAAERARAAHGTLLFRNDDLDPHRSKPHFIAAMIEDLRWLGLEWQPPIVNQSERLPLYRAALDRLIAQGDAYACTCTRKDLARLAHAPHEEHDDEPVYDGHCRPIQKDCHSTELICHSERSEESASHPAHSLNSRATREPREASGQEPALSAVEGPSIAIRFRIPDSAAPITFHDHNLGPHTFIPGRDFGDFLLWSRDGVPSYQLASTVDDAALGITEVVRGADLLKSTARQILLQRALGLPTPAYFHCRLVRDAHGVRLAKRHDALSLRTLREQGLTPQQLIASFDTSL
jgi:glutamyl-tRNA synthetase